MKSLILSFAVLIMGYLVYGSIIEAVFAPDNRKTPAYTREDGVDFMPMPAWKAFLVQLLNIAGTGPIFGALMGACFGPMVFLWIILGSVLAIIGVIACPITSGDGVQIISKDDGVSFDMADEDISTLSLSAYTVASYLEKRDFGNRHLTTMSFNRSSFFIQYEQ